MTRGPDPAAGPHLATLPGTTWQVWRDAVLRTTGFPAEGLLRLASPESAAVADAHLAGRAPVEQVAAALAGAFARCSREIHEIAADPLFREAVTWQNATALHALDGVVKAGPAPRRNSMQRQRERVVARYWQRYCGKTETIGFFGPICWIAVDPDTPGTVIRPGPGGMLRDRRVHLEHWALTRLADSLCADPRIRQWLPPSLQPQLTLDGGQVLDPVKPPAALTAPERAVLELCDGRRLAREVAQAAVADPACGFRKEADVYLTLGKLAGHGLLRWGLDLPVSMAAEQTLRERLAAIGDPGAREPAMAALDRLCAARDAVAAAAGDPAGLAAALEHLDQEFTALTGAEPHRGDGRMYAARRVCFEDTTRDLDMVAGGQVMREIAAPLSVLLPAARWLSATMCDAYLAQARRLHAELAEDLGTSEVPLGQLWYLAQALFYGTGPRPADQVTAEFGRRLCRLYGLDQDTAGGPLQLDSGELAARAAELFPAERPGWSYARIHSPDLLICASGPDAVTRGDFTVVLSELHVALPTCAAGLWVAAHPDPARLHAAYRDDIGGGRITPLLPEDWPRNTARLALVLGGQDDAQLGFTPAPGGDPDRLTPITALTVADESGRLVARGPDTRAWPLEEVFARPLAEVSVDAFKLAISRPHTPRVAIDRLVVARETWRTTVAATGLPAARGDTGVYLAARRWRRDAGLPEQVFVTIGTETKPVFADLTSPLYVESLAAMLRAAAAAAGGDVPVTVTEMLPGCDQAWVPDAAGRRYLSELRLHVRDPEPAGPPAGERP